MGKLIKNHWARLIVLTAAVYQIAASLESFFWPKIFFDFLTTNLNSFVKPYPILQSLNLTFGICMLALEYPLPLLAGTALHRSIEARLVILPLGILMAILLYQATNPAIYYSVALAVYFWAYVGGERLGARPWTLPSREVKGKV